MQGRRFCSAISCARRCFLTVIGKYVPPLTVASLATITHSCPSTTPMPVTMPADGRLAVVHAPGRQRVELQERRVRDRRAARCARAPAACCGARCLAMACLAAALLRPARCARAARRPAQRSRPDSPDTPGWLRSTRLSSTAIRASSPPSSSRLVGRGRRAEQRRRRRSQRA